VTEQRLLVISPVRNEAAHFERVALAMAAQTRPPDAWVVVDDGSTDGNAELVDRLAAEIPFLISTRARKPEPTGSVKDRLAAAGPPRAFNAGLRSVQLDCFTHISKLDGDMELPPRYFETLLEEFARDPRLGIAGGMCRELVRGRWRRSRIPAEHHVHGALKCYSLECFEAIGGVQERLGWDAIDQTYARMLGFRTHSFSDLLAIHHRPSASADGTLRGRARHGEVAYIVRLTPLWVTLRAFKVARSRPAGLSGAAFLYGYLRAAAQRRERVEDPEFRRFVRRELHQRMRTAVTPAGLRQLTQPRAGTTTAT
jgi:biofilm PGA synthesis N-glycosyltransferase PgaC